MKINNSNKKIDKKENKKYLMDIDDKISNIKHQEVLAKIENIVGKKQFEKNDSNSFYSKINKSTVLCFDNVSIEENEEENKSIEIKMEEFESKINSFIGDLVDFHPEETKKKLNNEMIRKNFNYISKYIINAGLNKFGMKRKTFQVLLPTVNRITNLNYSINNNDNESLINNDSNMNNYNNNNNSNNNNISIISK